MRAWLQCGGHDRDDSKNTTNLFDSPRQLLHPPKIRAKKKEGFTMFGSKEASEDKLKKMVEKENGTN